MDARGRRFESCHPDQIMKTIYFDIGLEQFDIPKPDFRISPEDAVNRVSLNLDTDGFAVYSPATGRKIKFPTAHLSDMPFFSSTNGNRGKIKRKKA